MTTHAVTIERLHNVYRVPAVHPDPQYVRGLLDRALQQGVPAACGAVLAGRFEADDPSIWLIRHLDIEFALDLDLLDEMQVAQYWGAILAGQIARAIAQQSDDVLVFKDRAGYIAQFLVDLANGSAWSKWYYAAFTGLRSLPAGMAAREALTREAGAAAAALRRLHEQKRLEQVLRLWSEREAAQVFDAIRRIEGAAPTRAEIMRVLAIWQQTRWPAHARAHNALRLVAASEAPISAAVELLLALAAALSPTTPAQMLADLAGGRAAQEGTLALAPSGDAALLAQWAALASGDRTWLTGVVQALAQQPRPAQPRARPPGTEQLLTAFGGAILLLRALALGDFAGDLAAATRQGALLRALLVAKGLGDAGALYDPVVGLVAGLERTPTQEDWALLAQIHPPALAESVAAQLIASGRVTGAALWAEPILYRGESFVLLRDLSADAWLDADVWPNALPQPAGAYCHSARLVLLGEGVDEAPFAGAPLRLRGSPSAWPSLPPGSDETLRQLWPSIRRRARPAAADLAYLAAAGDALTPAQDIAVALAARAVGRAFARRLLGFEWSSLAYLAERFLHGISTVTISAHTLQVELPQLPLNMILRLAGLDGEMFALPWLDDLAIETRLP